MASWLSRSLTRSYTSRIHRTTTSTNDFTHCVIGGGVVGLAVAARLAQIPNTTTILLERHRMVGTETSSRNSEVIHAGIYYPPGSLKTKLCIEGARWLYDVLPQVGVKHKKIGKWVVAQTPSQLERLHTIHTHATSLGVPTRWVSQSEATLREPLVKARAGILESQTTGVIDSHSYMKFLESLISDHGGLIAVGSLATAVYQRDRNNPLQGYRVHQGERPGHTDMEITADFVVNAAGLGAVGIHNMLIGVNDASRRRNAYFAKGSYYTARGTGKVGTLVYPVVDTGAGGLGTHLTVDLSGGVKFGPDVEWVEDPMDVAPSSKPEKLAAAEAAVREYLPGIEPGSLTSIYSGMRPKLAPEGSPFQDFVIQEEEGFPGFINLLGIESPGLTSSPAIARMTEDILYGKKSITRDDYKI